MEPHAAQDRLSFVCNWKHMHCEVKSKAKPTQPTRHPSPAPAPLPLPLGLGCHFLVQAKWESTCWTNWPGITCQIQFSRTAVSYVLWVFQTLRLKCEWQLRVCEEGDLDIESDMFSGHKQHTVLFICYSLWYLNRTGQGCKAWASSALTSLLCIREEFMIFADIKSHNDATYCI